MELDQVLLPESLLDGMQSSSTDEPFPVARMVLSQVQPIVYMFFWRAKVRGVQKLKTQPSQIILQQSRPCSVGIQKPPIDKVSTAKKCAQVSQSLNSEKLRWRWQTCLGQDEIIREMLITRNAQKASIKANDRCM
jgi:glutamate 5-kinase